MNTININQQSGQQSQIKNDAHQTACVRRTMQDVLTALPTVRPFLSSQQLEVMADACRGSEGAFFKKKFCELFQTIQTMPKVYEQDGAGDEAVAYLHYFALDCDWYITERSRWSLARCAPQLRYRSVLACL